MRVKSAFLTDLVTNSIHPERLKQRAQLQAKNHDGRDEVLAGLSLRVRRKAAIIYPSGSLSIHYGFMRNSTLSAGSYLDDCPLPSGSGSQVRPVGKCRRAFIWRHFV